MNTAEFLELPEEWTTGDVIVSGVRLHYTRTGGQKPPLVLAHGFSDDGLCWTPVARELETHFDVVMVDARGHGQSQAPEEGYGSEQMAHDLAGVISGLKLEKPIILGHSMGAATTLTLAGLYPELPKAILLEDPPAWWKSVGQEQVTTAPDREEWRRKTRLWIRDLQSKTIEELIERQSQQTPSWSAEEIALWAQAHLRLSPNVVNGRTSRGDWDLKMMEAITCPALLITADTQLGAIVSEGDADSLQKLIPQLKVAHISGAGHSIHREQFEAYMDAVQSFIRELG